MVTPVRAVDPVGGTQPDHRADSAALLTDARMRRAVDQALGGEVEHRLLKGSDQVQLGQHRDEDARVGRLPV